MSPVVDWFLLASMLKPSHELAKASKCGTFQHDILALTLNVCRNCSSKDLHDILAVRPVDFKLREVAKRLSKFIVREHDEIYLGAQRHETKGSMTLRSGKVKEIIPWAGLDSRDIGDKIYKLAFEYDKLDNAIIDKYQASSPSRLLFVSEEAVKWAAKVNKAIQKKSLAWVE